MKIKYRSRSWAEQQFNLAVLGLPNGFDESDMELIFHNEQGAYVEYFKKGLRKSHYGTKHCDNIKDGEYLIIEGEKYYLNNYNIITKGEPLNYD